MGPAGRIRRPPEDSLQRRSIARGDLQGGARGLGSHAEGRACRADRFYDRQAEDRRRHALCDVPRQLDDVINCARSADDTPSAPRDID